MGRLRCCGRFCYWRIPYGPWVCVECERTFAGLMPRSAEHRFWEAIEIEGARAENAARVDSRVNPELVHLFLRREGF